MIMMNSDINIQMSSTVKVRLVDLDMLNNRLMLNLTQISLLFGHFEGFPCLSHRPPIHSSTTIMTLAFIRRTANNNRHHHDNLSERIFIIILHSSFASPSGPEEGFESFVSVMMMSGFGWHVWRGHRAVMAQSYDLFREEALERQMSQAIPLSMINRNRLVRENQREIHANYQASWRT